MIREKFDKLIDLIFQEVKNYYGERLTSFILFSSCGRGTPSLNSDIDIFIILKSAPRGRIKRIEEFYKNVKKKVELYIEDIRSCGINILISPIIRTEEVNLGSPLYIDMLTGIRIYFDRDNFFRKYLNSLEEKLRKLGAEKRDGYWVYKKEIDREEGVEVFQT
ncbi:MAG: nucleotidyltransferase domain-containing protein [bacterium]|nr:nucleotidyltransferase domain-containing protein [bacterium]